MRIRFSHIIIIAAVILTVVSCRKETSIETDKGLAGTFTATIDGTSWIAADSTKGASILQGMINISGVSIDNKQVSITLNDTIPGVYVLNQVSASVAAYANNDSSNLYALATNQGSDTSQAGGEVTVTEIDPINKTISGTFSFKVYRDIDRHQTTITDGVFYKLSYISSLSPGTGADSMYALIDGTSWTAQSIVASGFSNQLAINGSRLDGSQSVSLIMPLDIAPGSYELDYTGLIYIGTYNPTATISLASTSGTLKILENNASTRRVRGYFTFLAADPLSLGNTSRNLTGGYFSIQYN